MLITEHDHMDQELKDQGEYFHPNGGSIFRDELLIKTRLVVKEWQAQLGKERKI